MNERSDLIQWLRGELVGPAAAPADAAAASFVDRVFADQVPFRNGPLVWRPAPDEPAEEVLYFDRESPHRKYGTGLLHPAPVPVTAAGASDPVSEAMTAEDRVGVDVEPDDAAETASAEDAPNGDDDDLDAADEFPVASPDVRRPSTVGISFCARFDDGGRLVIRLPRAKRLAWQRTDAPELRVNGRYESCIRQTTREGGTPYDGPAWRRHLAVTANADVLIERSELVPGTVIRRDVPTPHGSPVRLGLEVYARPRQEPGAFLVTAVLINRSLPVTEKARQESVLYQAYFDVSVDGGRIEKYPESERPFEQLDADEQSLALLYRESATWAIGHGCAAGWDAEPGTAPDLLYADVMPAVELPSMTPVVKDSAGNEIQLSMRSLAGLADDGTGPAWVSLAGLAAEYGKWIGRMRAEAGSLDANLSIVAARHLDDCDACLARIDDGLALLRQDPRVRRAFRLANLAMLLQQIATKRLTRRPLTLDVANKAVIASGPHTSPWQHYENGTEGNGVGGWRAFQIAFLLMSLRGVSDGRSPDRERVDLIWFPTGGGKTEAYLAVMAFYMVHERLLMADDKSGVPKRDGTNVLMRYTLRMLTTQQFQRAASLICAMEFLRREPSRHGIAEIPGQRFSLGLWIGREGSPNNVADADREVRRFKSGQDDGNPLVVTECPWCRAEIGRYDGPKPKKGFNDAEWSALRTRGIEGGSLLICPDKKCAFGKEQRKHWLPVEVIDERIYRHPPSLVIGTADKLAMVAYRPDAGALFGRRFINNALVQESVPPGLIVQDELHLISGPLGTMYALYEGIFERLCSWEFGGHLTGPKLIASTATIRGAADQVLSLYARTKTSLFPTPGLTMGDSFFGRYAREAGGVLAHGRLYLGIHASNYGSQQTAQVRAFAAAMFRAYGLPPDQRDPWWTLLAFYNSIRELGGAKTLFDSDIRSRLKFLFNREGYASDKRRHLRIVEELTSRLSQAEIVGMLDRLSLAYTPATADRALDGCLASNIIEVGVDIDRLSLMAVVGQPKTTATYIQVTGRVGRRWSDRPGLILMLYSTGRSRDRSHFEQFHTYHRRLYERVEPTSATPFALSAIQRAMPGALLTWARQQCGASVRNKAAYEPAVEEAFELLCARCKLVQRKEDQARSLKEMAKVMKEVQAKWGLNPQDWEEFPQAVDGEYLMLWPGQFATVPQKHRGLSVPSSMRQVDRSAELTISQGYVPVPGTIADAADD